MERIQVRVLCVVGVLKGSGRFNGRCSSASAHQSDEALFSFLQALGHYDLCLLECRGAVRQEAACIAGDDMAEAQHDKQRNRTQIARMKRRTNHHGNVLPSVKTLLSVVRMVWASQDSKSSLCLFSVDEFDVGIFSDQT